MKININGSGNLREVRCAKEKNELNKKTMVNTSFDFSFLNIRWQLYSYFNILVLYIPYIKKLLYFINFNMLKL